MKPSKTRRPLKTKRRPRKPSAARRPSLTRALQRSSTRALEASPSTAAAGSRKPAAGLAAYEREVRRELEKKIGKGIVPTDVYSRAYMQIVERSFRSDVHPRAVAGVVTIASGLAPEKAPPNGLCCGQR